MIYDKKDIPGPSIIYNSEFIRLKNIKNNQIGDKHVKRTKIRINCKKRQYF